MLYRLMGKNMNLPGNMKRKNNRKGSYLVEATLTIPIFFIAVYLLISIVPIIAECENISFGISEELRFECIKSAFRENKAALPLKAVGRTLRNNSRVNSAVVTEYKYLYTENGISDLISIKIKNKFSEKSPLGISSHASFSSEVTGRAFTGAYYHGGDSCVDDKWVFVFPEWGEAYHNGACTFVKGSCRLEYLSKALMQDYKPCKLCNASSAQLGSPVFCFTSYGKVYHLENCSTVDRYYIEMKKTEAEASGYRPCSKCGG